MKRILLPAGGAILATGLLAAGLASTAQADDTVSSDVLAAEAKAVETVEFWTKSNNAALKGAIAFNPDALEVSKIKSGGGYTSDTKPGSTAPIGEEKKAAVKVQNVNLPKTIGKVFFEGRDGKLYWCSGTSIQAQYRNLVATAGHCVYDIAGNDEVVSRWVFVPGYYQGKAPWGIYVGKQAFTHYDFDVYEDFDRDYAFVTVYDGIGGVAYGADKVSFEEYKAATAKGQKTDIKGTEVTEAEYLSGIKDPKTFPYYDIKPGTAKKVTGPDHAGAVVDKKEVTKATYDAALAAGKVGRGTDFVYGDPVTEQVDKATYDAYSGLGVKSTDAAGNFLITHYYVQEWYVPGTDTKFYRLDYYVISHKLKSVGRLGDNVGGQGFAWNQPSAGKYVRTFGYPYGPHLDGNRPYTGVTPKWCYGKTASKALLIPSKKVEEQQSLKCAVTAGYDGGPWLYKYSNSKRLGYVNGVTSLIADTDDNKRYDTITSAYFDGETNVIYKAAAAVWSGKLIK
ncbi:serine protease [Nonomuraea sp. MTCD27]|uniref:trypsin-like serine peptidase n=1 Tax=Nonomuraea sp. MTCD27 TaxID=1676747 RepID=UPI0035BF526F